MGTYPLPNKNITWLRSKTFNIGVDFEAWNGLLGITVDYLERRRSGIFAQNSSSLPTVVGAEAPIENINSDMNMGLELELSHRNKIGDFSYNVKGIVTVTRQKYLDALNQGPYGNSYERWRNDNLTHRYQGIQFGYESAGRFTGWEDIWSTTSTRKAAPFRATTSTLTGTVTEKSTDWICTLMRSTRLRG